MDACARRQFLLAIIKQQKQPISATALAKQCLVSRQLIVGDIALLRASGNPIIATPRGYLFDIENNENEYTIAVMHKKDQLKDELETIVSHGGCVMNVIVEHPLYGELCGNLHIYSQYDIDQFIKLCEINHASPLSSLTDGVHLHTIRVHDESCYNRILEALKQKGYLYYKES